MPDDGYPDGKLAKLAIETLEKLKQKSQPFFLAVGFFKPHLPFNAPKKYWDLYDPAVFALKDQTRVKGAPEIAYHTHRELGGYKDMPEDERVSAEQARTLRHGYYACVSYVDAQVGKVLDALQRLGLDQNTIVVLWGDHGWSLGEKDRWCKGTNFERDTRVPLMIRTPGHGEAGRAHRGVDRICGHLSHARGTGRPDAARRSRRAQSRADPARPKRARSRCGAQPVQPPLESRPASNPWATRYARRRSATPAGSNGPPAKPSPRSSTITLPDQRDPRGRAPDRTGEHRADPAYADSLNRLRAKLDETLRTRIKHEGGRCPGNR